MAKTVKYTKGSVIFLEGEKPKYIYILRDGCIEISRVIPDTEKTAYKTVKNGYFFGVKNMLVNMPYMSTAVATEDSTVALISVDEFEEFILQGSQANLEMIKNISKQLKQIHEKLYAKFDTPRESDCERGMLQVARSFMAAKEYQLCKDICDKFIARYPDSNYKLQIDEIIETLEKKSKDVPKEDAYHTFSDTNKPDIILPDAFKQYEKIIPARKVIFSEFEKGDSLFMVLSGIVRSAKYINGTNVNISLAKHGDFFGLNTFVDMDVRDVTCVTTHETKVLELSPDNFKKIISDNPKIAFMFIKLLAKRVYLDRRILLNSYLLDLQIRLKDMFAIMEENGLCEKVGNTSRKVNLTAENISVWTNISADIIQKELDILETLGLIRQSDEGWFIVKDIEKMYYASKRARRK